MKRFLLLALLKSVTVISFCQPVPKMRMADKLRIREAIRIVDQKSEQIWNGMKSIPFTLLLISDSTEFLVGHPSPPPEFQFSENDLILNFRILYRKRQFSPGFLATFPVNGINCIVVGTPEQTHKSSTSWIVTVLHEHFHKYAYSSPGYYDSVKKLELAGGDESGMWMLNYPFPYEDKEIIAACNNYSSSLLNVISLPDDRHFKKYYKSYLKARKTFTGLLKDPDYRYFSFQLWQEGLARYTEYKFLEQLENYSPSSELLQLKDFISFKKYKEDFLKAQWEELKNLRLYEDKRVCFYVLGFAEGLLLDKVNPDWRKEYLQKKFFIEKYLKKS